MDVIRNVCLAGSVWLGALALVMYLCGLGMLFRVGRHAAPQGVDSRNDGHVVWHEWNFRRGIAYMLVGTGLASITGLVIWVCQAG